MRQRIIAEIVFWLGCCLIIGGSLASLFIHSSVNDGLIGLGALVGFFGIFLRVAFA